MILFTITAPNIEKNEINFTLQADSARRIDQFVMLLKTNSKNSLNVRYSFLIFSIPATDIFRYPVPISKSLSDTLTLSAGY